MQQIIPYSRVNKTPSSSFLLLHIPPLLFPPLTKQTKQTREDEKRHDWIDSSKLKPQDHLEYLQLKSLQHKGKQQV